MPPKKRVLPFASSACPTPEFAILEADWKSLETALGKELSADVRGQLIGMTANFLHFAPFELAAEPLDDTDARLTKVRKAASAFQQALNDGRSSDARFFATHLIERHFDDARIGKRQTIHNLSGILTSFIVACTKAQAEIDGDGVAGHSPGEAWKTWIRNVVKLLQENGLPTQVRKDTDKNRSGPSPFVRFIDRLQTCFDRKYRRAIQSPEALAEAITRARRGAKPRKTRAIKTRNKKS
ncbi:hypothetical protein [Bradyrhizobium diazoefficiens]